MRGGTSRRPRAARFCGSLQRWQKRGTDMAISNVGIIGTGAMGLGITQVCAQAGCNVIAVKATPGSWEKAKGTLDRSLGKMVERGKMQAEDKEAILGRVTFSTDERAVADCELVIESVI